MHNHVLAETSLTVAALHSNVPPSDQSEDSDYDSVWISQSHRTTSFSRKMLLLDAVSVSGSIFVLILVVVLCLARVCSALWMSLHAFQSL